MLRSGEQIYGLTVLQHCGGGAYGEVYYCCDASGKELALKVVSKAKVGSGWKRELKGITHYRKLAGDAPGLLTLYHVGEDEDTFYYTMELADALPGQSEYKADTLAARLANRALPQEQLIPVLTAILDNIRTLHEAGFAHRDIKPENILFIKGTPKLADMGVLSPLSGTMTQLAGTLDFLPPEERSGESPSDSRESRQRNDLYAFGKIIYCCVTGNGANKFPSTPSDMPFTLHNKLFFRLAMRLCDKEPTRRLKHLSELLAEFQRTVRLCQYGESTWDKLRYVLSATGRNIWSLFIRTLHLCRRHWCMAMLLFCVLYLCRWHWCMATLLFCVLLAGFIRLGYYIASRPDKASEELAKTLQEQKKTAEQTEFTKAGYTFYNNLYSVAVPTDWQLFDHETIVKSRLPGDVISQRMYAIIIPKEFEGNESTVISIMVLPVTAGQLQPLNDQEKIALLKPMFADDVEAISIRQYNNPRLNLETILFIGEAQPNKKAVCYLYPRNNHTLCLNALMPQDNFNEDMGKFLAIVDSLIWRASTNDAEK